MLTPENVRLSSANGPSLEQDHRDRDLASERRPFNSGLWCHKITWLCCKQTVIISFIVTAILDWILFYLFKSHRAWGLYLAASLIFWTYFNFIRSHTVGLSIKHDAAAAFLMFSIFSLVFAPYYNRVASNYHWNEIVAGISTKDKEFNGNSGMAGSSLERLKKAFLPESDAMMIERLGNFSIIIAVRNEDDYICKTIQFTLQNTPSWAVQEIILIDDASDRPVTKILKHCLTPKAQSIVRVIRFDQYQGLIRARLAGAEAATANNLFFMDGHCKPMSGWHLPLLKGLADNYRRILCPGIFDMDASFKNTDSFGYKMMFSWNFEFDWYDDGNDEVPVSAGGVLAITKRWFEESGKYDPGMKEWGGENIEQSIRTWLCGGEIHVARDSAVGHIFDRPAKPNPGNSLVIQIQKNQKRAALTWLDDYYEYFETGHPGAVAHDPGVGLEARIQLRKELKCKPFQWYLDRFRTAFERFAPLRHLFHHIQHVQSGWCLSTVPNPADSEDTELELKPCSPDSTDQLWQPVAGGRMLQNRSKGCLTITGKGTTSSQIHVTSCDFSKTIEGKNPSQVWLVANGRIFNDPISNVNSKTGVDYYAFDLNDSLNLSSSRCMESSLKISKDFTSQVLASKKIPTNKISSTSCKALDKSHLGEAAQNWTWLW